MFRIEPKTWLSRSKELIASIEGKTSVDAQTLRELFNLHNDRMMPQEWSTHCGACASRVISKVREHISTWNDNEGKPNY